MKPKHTRIIIMSVVGLLAALVLINLGLNFWLKKKLPGYIKNQSDYMVTYHALDVDVLTGNIFATGFTINSQNPDNTNVIGLQGTIDTLSVARLGLYDLIVKKNISTTALRLVKPNLNIVLAKPVDDRTGKKRNPVGFENIHITGGNVDVFQHTKRKMLGVKNLNLNIQNLKMTEKNVEQKLPFVFDHYDISGTDFFYRPDNLYAFTAKKITTSDAKMVVQNFRVIPLMSYKNFRRYFPAQKMLLDLRAAQMTFKDIRLDRNKLALSNAAFENPEIILYTAEARRTTKKKDLGFDIELANVQFNNAKIDVRKAGKNSFFTAASLTTTIAHFAMNNETAARTIPFSYDDFQIRGNEVSYTSDGQKFNVKKLSVLPKSIDLQQITARPVSGVAANNGLDLEAKQIHLNMNEWEFRDKKLALDAKDLRIDQLRGSIRTGEKTQKQKAGFQGIHFPLRVGRVLVTAPELKVVSKNEPMVLRGVQMNLDRVEMNAKSVKNQLPFEVKDYRFAARQLEYATNFYRYTTGQLNLGQKNLDVSNFVMKPTVSRAQFIRMIPTERDLYDIKVPSLKAAGSWDFLSDKKFADVKSVNLNGVVANIFRSKIPADDTTTKPMYSELLRSIKFPLFVENLDLQNSLLTYEEDTKKSDGPGKLTFNSLNLNLKNLNSAKMRGRPTQIPIIIHCQFMNASPMNVRWTLDTARPDDAFAIAGNIADLPAARINPFIEPYLKIQATGLISDLIFNFNGNKNGIGGELKMVHQDLKITILKQTGQKDKLLSAVANIFVKTDSGNYPASVTVDGVERDATKSFFNLFWRGIEQGLKKTLIGNSAPKAEETIKTTVDNTKAALEQNKKDLQETKAEVQAETQQLKETVKPEAKEPKKESFLQKIFKKKSGS